MTSKLHGFAGVWLIVWRFDPAQGERIKPLCVAATEVRPNVTNILVAPPNLRLLARPPYPVGSEVLLVTLDASVLVGCHLALGWEVPERIIDLLIEFRVASNDRSVPFGTGLMGALAWFGLPVAMADVRSASAEGELAVLKQLLTAMLPTLDLGRALLRGRYLTAVARMEDRGIPVDWKSIENLAAGWPEIRSRILKIVDRDFGLFPNGRLNVDEFERWLSRHGIDWSRRPDGSLDLSEDVFRDMARTHRRLQPLKDLGVTLRSFNPRRLAIGTDGRNRTSLRPFSARTGRNQPSVKVSAMGQAAWIRHLVRPEPGMGLALIDWCQQEFGIAAALSGDTAMQAAYLSGDPYLALAVLAGAAPPEATSATYPEARARFKVCALGLQYGMGSATLARLVGLSEAAAMELQRRHRAAFPAFWQWSDAIEIHAMLVGHLTSAFGWRIHVGPDANPRSLRNFPLQANGAEMLRLACCLSTEAGIQVCLPLHDALLIEAPLEQLDDAIAATQEHMAEASRIVLDGFTLRSEVKVVRFPDRYRDERGARTWQVVEQVLAEREAPGKPEVSPAHQRNATCSSANPRTVLLYVCKEDRSDASD